MEKASTARAVDLARRRLGRAALYPRAGDLRLFASRRSAAPVRTTGQHFEKFEEFAHGRDDYAWHGRYGGSGSGQQTRARIGGRAASRVRREAGPHLVAGE